MTQKTPEYTRRAVQKYRENKDQINLVLDKGIKARIETLTGEKASAYIKKLVMDDLQRLESGADGTQDQDQKPAPAPDRLHAIETEKKPTPDADEVQKLIDEKRKQYELEKEAEQTQEDAQKTRLFNMNDYK